MRKINARDRQRLEEAGLIRYARKNSVDEPNLVVANREHCGRDKTYYVVEDEATVIFMGWENDKDNNGNFVYDQKWLKRFKQKQAQKFKK